MGNFFLVKHEQRFLNFISNKTNKQKYLKFISAAEQYQNNLKNVEIEGAGRDFIFSILCGIDFSPEQHKFGLDMPIG